MKKQKQIKNKRKIPWKIVSVILLLLAILGLIIGFSVDWSRPSWIFISGSSTMQPLLQAISNNYQPSEITADAGGSSVGITNVLNNKKNIGAASKTPSSSMVGVPNQDGKGQEVVGTNQEQWKDERLKTVTIGWDGIGVVYKKVGPLAGDTKVVLNPETVKWLYLAFAGYMDVDATNLLVDKETNKTFKDAIKSTSPTSDTSIVPFARSGGTQQSGTAEAFTADSRLLKKDDKYNSKAVLSEISQYSTNPTKQQNGSDLPKLYSEVENEGIWGVLEGGQYGPLTHTTAESNLQTWNSIQSYNGKGIPFTYLSAGFIKNNYDEIQKAGFGVAYYQESTTNGSNELVPLITKGKDGKWSNENVSQKYMWFRPLNLILKSGSASYIQQFIEWLIGNSLFEKSEYRKVLDEQGFIPLTQKQIETMFSPKTSKGDSIIEEIAEYVKKNPNSKYDDFVKEKGQDYVENAWKPFWTESSDYQLLETQEHNDRITQQVYYGAIPKSTSGDSNNNSGK